MTPTNDSIPYAGPDIKRAAPRPFFNVLAGMALALCLTAVGFWADSYRKALWIHVGPPSQNWLIASDRGQLQAGKYLFESPTGHFAEAELPIAIPYALVVTFLAIAPLLWLIVRWRKRRPIAAQTSKQNRVGRSMS